MRNIFEPRLIALLPKEYGIWNTKEHFWEHVCRRGYRTKQEAQLECNRLWKLWKQYNLCNRELV